MLRHGERRLGSSRTPTESRSRTRMMRRARTTRMRRARTKVWTLVLRKPQAQGSQESTVFVEKNPQQSHERGCLLGFGDIEAFLGT